MKATQQLHDAGQSLWLDNITRGILADGTLERYIRDLSVTGLTSNPTIFDHAIINGLLSSDGGEAELVLAEFRQAGIDDGALAAQLQREGAESFDESWKDLLDRLAAKRAALAPSAHAPTGNS
jgi:transaldolase